MGHRPWTKYAAILCALSGSSDQHQVERVQCSGRPRSIGWASRQRHGPGRYLGLVGMHYAVPILRRYVRRSARSLTAGTNAKPTRPDFGTLLARLMARVDGRQCVGIGSYEIARPLSCLGCRVATTLRNIGLKHGPMYFVRPDQLLIMPQGLHALHELPSFHSGPVKPTGFVPENLGSAPRPKSWCLSCRGCSRSSYHETTNALNIWR